MFSQNIQSNCWNSALNIFGVLANLYSTRICCIYMYISLIDKSFSGTCDNVCSPLGSKTFYTQQKQRLKMT